MNITKKLFYQDPYMTCFDATVVSCEQSGDVFHIVLNATAFYPEGGGQPADTGTLNGIKISDVHEKSGEILHYAEAAIEPGTAVHGEIDWERRYAFMQHHTGEHIVSGIIHDLYGYDNVGFRMGDGYTTLDTDAELTPEQLYAVELLANRATRLNAPVTVTFPTSGELGALAYRSKKALSGNVRIVTVEGYDICACCGLHCKTTAEAGPIKFLSSQKYKAGTRIFMLSGEQAFLDYRTKSSDIMELSQILSAKPDEVVAGVNRLNAEILSLKQQIYTYRNEIFAQMIERAAAEKTGDDLVYLFADNLDSDSLRRLAVAAAERFKIAAIFSAASDGSHKYALAGSGGDMREYAKIINAACDGRGGGQKNLVQGSVFATSEKILDTLENMKTC